jgi:hypothetical protein
MAYGFGRWAGICTVVLFSTALSCSSFDSGYCGIHGSIQKDPWIYFDCVISCYKYRGEMIPDIEV